MAVIKSLLKRSQRFLLFIFVNFIAFISSAQVFSFDNYSVVDGLIQSNVKTIVQDKQGNIWLGTEGGLTKFDGKNFQNYLTDDGLADNSISAMTKDRSGNLWIGHTTGAITLLRDGKFEVLDTSIFPKGKKVLTIFQDSKNSIWISFQDFGVIRIIDPNLDLSNSNNYTVFKNRAGLSALVVDIAETKSGELYFVTDIGIKHFIAKENTFEFLKIKDFESVQATRMLEDNEGNLWVGIYLGGPGILVRMDPKTNTTKTFMLPSFVSYMMKDKAGNIWVATWGNGIAKFDVKKNSFVVFNEKNGLNAAKNYCLLEDREGNIIIGSQNNGFYVFKGERFVTYSSSSGLGGEQVNAVVEDDQKNIWIGTNMGLSVLDVNENKIQNYEKVNGSEFNVRALAKDRDGNLWIGTSDQKVIQYSVKTNKFSFPSVLNDYLSSPIINALVFDKSGKLWIGTSGSGLCMFDPNKGSLPKSFTVDDGFYGQSVRVNAVLCDHNGSIWCAVDGRGLAEYDGKKFKLFTKEDGFAKTNITSLAEDALGNIWIGTSGDGLFIYNRKQFKHFKTRDGLLSDLINLITVDEQNNVWIGTNKGLNKYVSKDSAFISYNKNEGFKSIETKTNAAFADKTGNVWFGTVNGLIKYNAGYDQLNTLETLTNITEAKVNYTYPLTLSGRHKLGHNENTITFYYSGICISNPDAVRYSVMLEGAEKDWRPSTKENTVTYSSLSPGNYIFKVKASNNLGTFNKEPVVFSFHISPPWYTTWWAYLMYIVVGIAGFFMYVKWRERKLVVEKTILEEKVHERTVEVVEKNKQLDEKNKDIMASIRYAKRIQNAILPPDELVTKFLPKTFILFKPKDIVSGDFYWLHDKGDKILFAAVDCTGHGVPGAFMSIIGHNHLEQIVGNEGITQPATILDALNKSVSETLRQSSTDEQVKDGMDIALCMFDRKTNEFHYAGAFNPMYWIRNGELHEIKANKFPIGNLRSGEQPKFTNHTLKLEKGDALYIFSDGYADQFGGPNGKKLKYSAFKKMLLGIQQMNMEDQGAYLDKAIEEWKGSAEQVDDILVIGTRL
jgi:ligand-binding sensor domain-containing protein/serine phosphatase RsbU (regulator of sigma subunit)